MAQGLISVSSITSSFFAFKLQLPSDIHCLLLYIQDILFELEHFLLLQVA